MYTTPPTLEYVGEQTITDNEELAKRDHSATHTATRTMLTPRPSYLINFLILIEKSDGYTASIRAPQNNPLNAHQVALKFETGGGRHTAAGIQHLPADQISYLERELTRHYCPH